MSVKAQRKKSEKKAKAQKKNAQICRSRVPAPKDAPRKGWGEGRVEARILQTNVLYSIQGPCFMDNESPA
jgi:hypothetical protein